MIGLHRDHAGHNCWASVQYEACKTECAADF